MKEAQLLLCLFCYMPISAEVCEMKDQIKYIAAMLIYGTNGIVASFIDLPSEEIVLMRTLIGGALLSLLVLLSPKLASVRTDYERVVRQRNALLKSAGTQRRSGTTLDLRTLDVWDDKAAAAGAQLVAARVQLVNALRPHLVRTYEQVSAGQSEARMFYRASVDRAMAGQDGPGGARTSGGEDTDVDALTQVDVVEARLLEAMAHLRSKEIERGVSLVGPHRDDLELFLDELPAKGYASHGESWSLALGLRLASYELLKADDDWHEAAEPVLILDDVFAELDVRRRDRLARLIAPAEQVLITAAVAEDVPEVLEGARVDVMGSVATRVR